MKHSTQEEHFSAWSLYKSNREARLMFSYRGPFRDHLTEGIIGISENTLEGQEEMSRMNRKVSFLLVECFQNILKHGERIERMELDEDGMFSFRAFSRSFYINSINSVKEEDRKRLSAMVEHINSLDRTELKALYKRQLQENVLSDRGGAGLGLIELARKSGQPITYAFEDEADRVLFHNQVFFKRDEQEAEHNFTEETRVFRQFMAAHGILMCYKGDFSQGAILPLLNIVELNLQNGLGSVEAKRVGHVLIEMLQNISHHAPVVDGIREGVIIIGQTSEGLYVETGNAMPSSYVNELNESLGAITAQDEEGLKNMHLRRFKESIHLSDKHSSGLGLLQIAKACRGRIHFAFDKMDDDHTFFTLSAIV